MQVVTFKADGRLVELIDALARELGVSRSEVIRAALITFAKVLKYSPRIAEQDLEDQWRRQWVWWRR